MKLLVIYISFIAVSAIQIAGKEIIGQVVTSDLTPIEYANISAFINDSIIGGGVTDINGRFWIEVSDSCNHLVISFIGYDDAVIMPPISNDLGQIMLQLSLTLKEIVVKAPIIRRDADRFVVNVSANPLSQNKNAHDLLKTAPGVWATDETLYIYGQSDPTIYVDDIKISLSGEQLTSYLKSIQSSSIASIEIIPKAGAEYSADSTGGIIRINLRRNRIDGFFGSMSFSSTIGKYKQWYNPSANFSLHSDRWTVSFAGSINGSPSDRYASHEESTNAIYSLALYGISHHKSKALQSNTMIGIQYEHSPKDKIALQIDYYIDKSRRTSDSKTETYDLTAKTITNGEYKNRNIFHNLDITLNWSHSLDDKGSVLKLISDYNFRHSSVTEDNLMAWSNVPEDSAYTTDNTNRYNIFTGELSLHQVINPQWSLNSGAKYTYNNVAYRSIHHHLDGPLRIGDCDRDIDNYYDESIIAIYATVNGQAGRWKFKAGLRGEYFRTKGHSVDYSQTDLFPNANISFNLTDNGSYVASAGYYKNIRRPSFQSLNPAVRQESDYSYSVGNPGLTPSYTDAVSLDCILAGKFTIAAGYSHTDKPIRQMFISDPSHPERMYLTWGNEGTDRNLYIHADGFMKLTDQWNLYSNVTYMIASQKLDAISRFDSSRYIQIIASTTYMLPAGFNLTMNCFYNSKMKTGNITVYPIFNLTPSIQKQLGDNWTVSLSMDNMLQHAGKIKTSSSGYDRVSQSKQHASARLSISYNFNSGKGFRTPRIEKNTDDSRLGKD